VRTEPSPLFRREAPDHPDAHRIMMAAIAELRAEDRAQGERDQAMERRIAVACTHDDGLDHYAKAESDMDLMEREERGQPHHPNEWAR
jgi:hypothetical protein